jgi:hypothetical protein
LLENGETQNIYSCWQVRERSDDRKNIEMGSKSNMGAVHYNVKKR